MKFVVEGHYDSGRQKKRRVSGWEVWFACFSVSLSMDDRRWRPGLVPLGRHLTAHGTAHGNRARHV